MEIRIIYPDVHGELELTNQACTTDKGSDPPLNTVIGGSLRKRRSIRASSSDHFPALHINGGVAWIHAPNVRSERARETVRVHFAIIKIIRSLRICTKAWIVMIGCKNQWCAASPSAHKLRRDQFLLFLGFAVFAEKLAKCTDVFLQPEISQIAAITGKDCRLRQRRRRAFLVVIAEKEFTCLDRRPRSPSRFDAHSLDHRLRKPIAVAEVFPHTVEWRDRFEI